MELLKGRGLEDWQAGRMSDSKFINGLAKEWASLPNSSGRGHYNGQRAGTTVGGLLTALGETRKGGTQVASLDPSIGLPTEPVAAYRNITDEDGEGNAGQIAKFMEWNSDPVGNYETNLKSIEPSLAGVVQRAKEIAGVDFTIGSGKRDKALQKKAKEWGWSRTEDSDHVHGDAVDLWPVDAEGAVSFDPHMQSEIVAAMKQAAQELGVDLDAGAEWKSFKDAPHFGIKKRKKKA